MKLSVAIQMDHVSTIDIDGDSTFVLGLEAEQRGYALWHYTPPDLIFRDRKVLARAQPMKLRREKGNHFTLGAAEMLDLATIDVVLLRQDPPFDMSYITTTHLLEHIHPKTLVVNDPASVRNAPEKLFVTHFDNVMPPTLITADARALREFRDEHKDIILKPLFGNGGAGVFRVRPDDENFNSLLEMFSQRSREPVIAQRYLPEVRKGDKRIILIDGKAVGAIDRVPAAGRGALQHACRRQGGEGRAHQARHRAVRDHRPGARAARPALRRHRRDRRLSHRDQRHVADRPAADQPFRRRVAGSADLGSHRGALPGNTRAQVMSAAKAAPIWVTGSLTLDPSEIEESFVRATGPGGQHVNTTSTAVQLRFDVRHSPSLTDDVRHRLERLAGRRLTRDGVIVLVAQGQRSQKRNREEALDRLVALVREAARPPVPRKKTRVSKAAKRRRVDDKKHHGAIKSLRSKRARRLGPC